MVLCLMSAAFMSFRKNTLGKRDLQPQRDTPVLYQETNFGWMATEDGSMNTRAMGDQYSDNSVVTDVEIPGDQATINDKLQQEMVAMAKQMAAMLNRVDMLHNTLTGSTTDEVSAPKVALSAPTGS